MKEQDRRLADRCSAIVDDAIQVMREAEIPANIIVDRLATYGAFVAVMAFGKQHTAEQFRRTADAVEAGLFDGVGRQPAGRG